MPHKHTSSTILCVLAGFTFGYENSFGFVGENAMKLKKLIEVRFKNSKTAKVEENGYSGVGNREFLKRKSRNDLLRGCALLSKLESSLHVERFLRSKNVQLV